MIVPDPKTEGGFFLRGFPAEMSNENVVRGISIPVMILEQIEQILMHKKSIVQL